MDSRDLRTLELTGQLVEGVWLPKHEQHLLEWMTRSKGAVRHEGKITYQWRKQIAALSHAHARIPDLHTRVFVDIGAHVGLWSMWWARTMSGILAYEPVPDFSNLFWANVLGNMAQPVPVVLRPYALLDAPGETILRIDKTNTGNTHVALPHEGTPGAEFLKVPVTTLDDDIGDCLSIREQVGVLKIDCEGVEVKVLQGAAETIDTHKPLIVVEQKKQDAYQFTEDAIQHLETKHGYEVLECISGDYIMAPVR